MKKFVFLFITVLSASVTVQAQTFLQHLQAKEEGKGTVTVTQSKQIEELVNASKTVVPQVATTPKKQEEKKVKPAEPKRHEPASPQHREPTKQKEEEAKHPQKQEPDSTRKESLKREAEVRNEESKKKTEQENDSEFDIPTVDLRKKVMRGAYKVNGYRVQVFSGGNSRADKEKAQRIGNNIKMAFPDQPVYVHFYSPSWKCRIGNYRTYAEAEHMMKQLKKMGYKQACILRGKITVQD